MKIIMCQSTILMAFKEHTAKNPICEIEFLKKKNTKCRFINFELCFNYKKKETPKKDIEKNSDTYTHLHMYLCWTRALSQTLILIDRRIRRY